MQIGAKFYATGFGSGSTQYNSANSLSYDGTTFLVQSSESNPGIVLFSRVLTVWTQTTGPLYGSGFSGTSTNSTSILNKDGNAVCLVNPDDNGGVGGCLMFVKTGTWAQSGGKLVGTGFSGTAGNMYASISSNGDTLALSRDNDNSGIGATWIFQRNSTIWVQQGSKLVGTGYSGSSILMSSVALSDNGDTLAVSGNNDNSKNGAVWIFSRSAGVWTQQGSKLVATGGSTPRLGINGLQFNSNADLLCVSGPRDDTLGTNVGAFWMFSKSGGPWVQQGGRLYGTGFSGDRIRQSNLITMNGGGDLLFIGGPGDSNDVGCAWKFTKSGSVWTQQSSKLKGTGFTGGDFLNVCLNSNSDVNLIMGAVNDSNGTSSPGSFWYFS